MTTELTELNVAGAVARRGTELTERTAHKNARLRRSVSGARAKGSDRAKEVAESLCLTNRLALRPREAAAALGVSERKLRQLLPKLPHVRENGVVLLPVAQLQRWLADRARAQEDRADAIAREQLGQLEREPVTRRE